MLPEDCSKNTRNIAESAIQVFDIGPLLKMYDLLRTCSEGLLSALITNMLYRRIRQLATFELSQSKVWPAFFERQPEALPETNLTSPQWSPKH